MYVHVKVTPGAKKETFKQLKTGHFVVSVKEPALRNLANRRVAEILSAHLAPLGRGQVRLISGHRSPGKIFRVEGPGKEN